MVPDQQELGWQRILMAVNEGVDAIGVGLKPFLRGRRQGREAALGFTIESEGAYEFVARDPIGAENLGQPPLAAPALRFHLEEPLACVKIAERAGCVVHRGGEDMRDAIGVAPDPSLGREAGQFLRPGVSRHGAPEKIAASQRRDHGQSDDEPQEALKQPPPHPAHLPSRRFSVLNLPLSGKSTLEPATTASEAAPGVVCRLRVI